MLGLCFARAFSLVVAGGGFYLVVVHGFLFAVASLVGGARAFKLAGFSSAWAQEL